MLDEYGSQRSEFMELLVIAGSGQALQKHMTVFKDELGKVKGVSAKIHVEPHHDYANCASFPMSFREEWNRSWIAWRETTSLSP